MQDAIDLPPIEIRGWLARIVHENVRLERTRLYLQRLFGSWVEEDPDPGYSRLDRADGLGVVTDVTSDANSV